VREERLKLARSASASARRGALLRGVLRMAAISDLRNPSDVVVLGQAERSATISARCSWPWSMTCAWH
jgi:GTP pyrophosphokinase